jgi:hypothetical protein
VPIYAPDYDAEHTIPYHPITQIKNTPTFQQECSNFTATYNPYQTLWLIVVVVVGITADFRTKLIDKMNNKTRETKKVGIIYNVALVISNYLPSIHSPQ